MRARRTAALTATLAAAAVSACAGGGSGSAGTASAPAPITTTPTSPPPPPPPSPSDFEDAEYLRDYSLDMIGASTAYALGATGEGVTVAVIDTGVDVRNREFHDQLAPGITDIISERNHYGDGQYHGTVVAGIIAASRDGFGMHGVAPGADILSIRADSDRLGGCPENCLFEGPDLAEAIDYAVDNGARIINISLGGDTEADPLVTAALERAVQSGVLIVAAAGNSGLDTPSAPANFAGGDNALFRAVAVGAVDENGEVSSFSNVAGGVGGYYVLAPGEGLTSTVPVDFDPVCEGGDTCYANGLAGTSFAAPHVAGALALTLEAFPYLLPEQALELLLATADDAGEPGVDDATGAGVLNVGRLFQPYGLTSLSVGGSNGGVAPVAVALAPPSGAFGDWAWHSGALDDVVIRDEYGRGFAFSPAQAQGATNTAGAFEAAAAGQRLDARAARTAFGAAAIRAPEDATLPLANLVTDRAVTPELRVNAEMGRLAFSAGRGFSAPDIGDAPGAGVLAAPANGFAGLAPGADWTAVQLRAGVWRVGVRAARDEHGAGYDAASVERRFGPVTAGFEAGTARERDAALGSPLAARFGGQDEARSSFTAMMVAAEMGAGWRVGARAELAQTDIAAPGYLEITEAPAASAWRVGAERAFDGGSVGLSLSQPPRAESGAVRFDAPVAVTARGVSIFETRDAPLTPSGREVNLEGSVRLRLADSAWTTVAARVTSEPGHVAGADAEGALWVGMRLTR